MDIQKQKGGDHSHNIQVNGNVTCGITYTEARQIALDVFNANCQTLMQEAARISEIRANKIVDDFIKRLFEEHPELSHRLQEPSIQYSTFSVIKNYVKTGDEDLKERLLGMLIHRMGAKDRSMEQIVLDEAIEVLPKLTQDHVNILSLILSAIYINHNINNLDKFKEFINNKLIPFYPNNRSDSSYTHLQYTGCCTLLSEGGTYKPLPEIFRQRYCGLFYKGFSPEILRQFFLDDYEKIESIVTVCQQNRNLLQFNAMNESVLNHAIKTHNLDNLSNKIIQFSKQNQMNNEEIKKLLYEINPRMNELMEEWKGERSSIKSIALTSVGYAIAILNYNVKTKENISFNGFI